MPMNCCEKAATHNLQSVLHRNKLAHHLYSPGFPYHHHPPVYYQPHYHLNPPFLIQQPRRVSYLRQT